MDDYLIGAGAVLTAGAHGSIVGAALHAQIEPPGPLRVEAAALDFEAADPAELSRIVIVASGWRGARFEAEVIRPLLARGECTLVDAWAELARATGAGEVHLFARWLPDEAMTAALRSRGIRLLAHPLETIAAAALVCGQRHERWSAAVRAA